MLSINSLVKKYKTTLAVDDISFTVADGEILGLLGPNGAGKTTILRSIAGIIQPNAGNISISGYDLSKDEQNAKRNIAFVPETPNLYDMLTVYEHLRFIAMAYNTLDHLDERATDLLEKFDLIDKKNELVLSLSKGMKQKLAVVCAFIHDARVLLFDEPLIGIDPKGARELKDMMLAARESGCSVLISTHMLDTAERLCDRVLIIDEGHKIFEGTLDEIHEKVQMSEDASLEDMFLKLTEDDNVNDNVAVS
ncbi:ABC transporter ATP-binding protein [uncultured Desulfobulbus sp.]|uniref:ABC transporter ATP-binding protein n=1 Tax=uncultured Desulfobulbus sp. TaxID=239745 RepID=UPI0029C996A3|nr:ABC transporter ATP-binding protein [uncultured Desulfobulbus sp.]